MGANAKFETLGYIVRNGWIVAVQCECGHGGVIDGANMERWYMYHMWPTQPRRRFRVAHGKDPISPTSAEIRRFYPNLWANLTPTGSGLS